VVDGSAGHAPVLVRQVRELLRIERSETVVDATVGLGGHATMFADAVGPDGLLVGLDVDPDNLASARERLSGCCCRVELLQCNFRDLPAALGSIGVERVDVLFADLGVSSTQLDLADRGFSFMRDGPLDMRMDPRLTVTAADLINRLKERELGDLIYHSSQERASRRIARRICERRRGSRITTTGQLAKLVAEVLGVNPASRKSKIHPATRTFQALRIAVNDEIGALDALLAAGADVLKPGGRFGLVAFHSVEDRPVKLAFRKGKSEGIYRLLTKKPVVADEEERLANPRSRSAKLRVAVRLPEQ